MKKEKGKSKSDWLRISWFLLPFFFYLLSCIPSVLACPGCKEALFDPGQIQQKRSMARGYAISIGILLTMPAGLVGALAALIISARRRASREESAAITVSDDGSPVDTPGLSR